MSFYKAINIDALDKRFQVTFLKKYRSNSASSLARNGSRKASTDNLLYLTKTILKDIIFMPFAINFLTTLGKIFLGKYSVVLYRHGFVMGAHLKKIMIGYYNSYFLPVPSQ